MKLEALDLDLDLNLNLEQEEPTLAAIELYE
jgi:hypothetical protein